MGKNPKRGAAVLDAVHEAKRGLSHRVMKSFAEALVVAYCWAEAFD